MTERNFTSVIPGFYRTRAGDLAEVVQILDLDPRLTEYYPARGLIGTSVPYQGEWTMAGSALPFGQDSIDGGYESSKDLITFLGAERPREKKMVKKIRTRWTNLFENGDVVPYTSKRMADKHAYARIACVKVTCEYEVEVYE